MKRLFPRQALLAGALAAATAWADPAQVRISTTPADAQFEVDGIPRGATPTTVAGLGPGRHLVVVHKDGYLEVRRSFSLLEGQSLSVDIPLEEVSGLVLVHTQPPGAEVSMGGAFRGKTPLLLPNFPLGTHRLNLVLAGHFPREVEVTVKDRTPQWVKVDMVADSATLDVNSDPAGARVTINGSDRGTTPCRLDKIATGQAELVVALDGYAEYRETLKMSPGESYQVNANLRARPGSLNIVSLPPKGRVYVDNQFKGEAPISLATLAPGEHRVRVELKGFETDARTVKVRAGELSTEEFRLANNSGLLLLVTEPAGARVFVDGNDVGETTAATAGLVSEALRVDTLGRGEHTLQLQKTGYTYTPRKFSVEPGKASTLHERLTRIFNPDIEVRTRDQQGAETVVTGVLLRKYPGGDLELETRPGVIVRISASTIVDRNTIRVAP
jgi:hypothetical protein